MIIWVLWEDQREKNTNGFGPHNLLISCLEDDFGGRFDRAVLKARVQARPKKSNSKVLAELRANLKQLLDDGAVCAVFDRDQAHRMWHKQPARCRQALRDKILEDAPGSYEIVLIEDNIETLSSACSQALGKGTAQSKPRPAERDALLNQLAYRSGRELRAEVREQVLSFDRLVRKVGEKLAHL